MPGLRGLWPAWGGGVLPAAPVAGVAEGGDGRAAARAPRLYLPGCWSPRGAPRARQLRAAWCSWALEAARGVRGVSDQRVGLRCRPRPCALPRRRAARSAVPPLACLRPPRPRHGQARGLRSSRGASPLHVLACGRLGGGLCAEALEVVSHWGEHLGSLSCAPPLLPSAFPSGVWSTRSWAIAVAFTRGSLCHLRSRFCGGWGCGGDGFLGR